MSSSIRSYLFIVLSLSFLASLAPFISLLPSPNHLIIPQSSPSVINLDNLKDEYLITGLVTGYSTFPARDLVFLHLYRRSSYRIFGLTYSRFNHFAQLSLTDSGHFSHIVPSGDYNIIPLTLPQHGIFYSTDYPLSLAHHHPAPTIVSLPHTSIFSYLGPSCIDTPLIPTV